MTLVLGNVKEAAVIDMLLRTNNTYLKLYTNNYTPVNGSVAADFTEMSTLGYAHKELTAASWSKTSSVTGTLAEYAQQTYEFTDGTPVTVYGYYLIDKVTGLLVYAEKFANAQTITGADTPLKLTPKFNLD